MKNTLVVQGYYYLLAWQDNLRTMDWDIFVRFDTSVFDIGLVDGDKVITNV